MNNQPYYQEPAYGQPMGPSGDASKDIYAYIGLGLAIFSLCAWFIPLCGCPVSLVAGGLGYIGLPSNQSTLAKVAIGIAVLTFAMSICNGIAGVIIGLDS